MGSVKEKNYESFLNQTQPNQLLQTMYLEVERNQENQKQDSIIKNVKNLLRLEKKRRQSKIE